MDLPEFLIDHPDGEIRLTGHRIGLDHVVFYYNEGYSPEMLVCQLPTLPLALVHEVIAFYLENQAEVDAYVAKHEAGCERLRANAPASRGLVQLRRRLQERKKAETP
jgi:uncharacterized protein (DUF433 family)